jgi:lipopolysaccharide/colanic/teichoic acid biosynthesis glycosyltransferase
MLLPTSRAASTVRLAWPDPLIAVLAPVLARLARDLDGLSAEFGAFAVYLAVSAGATIASLAYFRVGGIVADYLCTADVRRIAKASLVGVLTGVLLLFTLNRLDQIPRSIPLLHILALLGLLVGWRLALGSFRERRPAVATAAGRTDWVILIGANRMSLLYIRMVSALEHPRPRIAGLLDDNAALHGRSVAGYPVLGGSAALRQVVSEYATHGVTIKRVMVMHSAHEKSRAIANQLAPTCAALGLHLDRWGDRMRQFSSAPTNRPLDAPAALPLTIRNPGYWRFRRAVDVIGASLALIVLSPLLLIVAGLVAFDVGLPVVFWQERIGRHGLMVRVFKFRTLRVPVDGTPRPIAESDRLSGIGRFLRATRLDELPQLFNVLRGDMTLIGPRPLLPIDQPANGRARLAVPPGLTGWAQVNGGKIISIEQKDALDRWYIANCGPLLDLKILGLTVVSVFRGDAPRMSAIELAMGDERKRHHHHHHHHHDDRDDRREHDQRELFGVAGA